MDWVASCGRYDALVLFAALALAPAALGTAPRQLRAASLTLLVVVASSLPGLRHILVLGHANEAIG